MWKVVGLKCNKCNQEDNPLVEDHLYDTYIKEIKNNERIIKCNKCEGEMELNNFPTRGRWRYMDE